MDKSIHQPSAYDLARQLARIADSENPTSSPSLGQTEPVQRRMEDVVLAVILSQRLADGTTDLSLNSMLRLVYAARTLASPTQTIPATIPQASMTGWSGAGGVQVNPLSLFPPPEPWDLALYSNKFNVHMPFIHLSNLFAPQPFTALLAPPAPFERAPVSESLENDSDELATAERYLARAMAIVGRCYRPAPTSADGSDPSQSSATCSGQYYGNDELRLKTIEDMVRAHDILSAPFP